MSDALMQLLESPDFPEGTYWKRQDYPANQEIIIEGDKPVDVYVLMTGTVRVLGTSELDEERTVRPGYSDLSPGAVFGEMSLFDDGPRSGSVVSVTDCSVVAINAELLGKFMDEHPQIGYLVLRQFIETMVGRLRKANQRVSSLFAWGLKAHGIDEDM